MTYMNNLYSARLFTLYAICLVAPLGNMTKFAYLIDDEKRGITLFLVILLISLTFIEIIKKGKFRNWICGVFFLLFLFFAWLGGFTISDQNTNSQIMILFGYATVTYCVFSLKLGEKEVGNIINILIFSLIMVASLSLINYFYFSSLLFVNDISTTWYSGDERINLQGPYHSRSSFSSYIIIGYSLVLGKLLFSNNKKEIAFLLFGLILILWSSILTHSRSLLIAEFIVFLYYLFFFWTFSDKKNTKEKLYIGLAILILSIIVIMFLEQPRNTITYLYNALNLQNIISSDSDMLRIKIIISSFDELKNNIFGVGFSRINIEGWKYATNPHNNIVSLIRAGGVFGSICIVAFFYPIITMLIKPVSRKALLISSVILGWAIIGMAHVNLSHLIIWVLFGLLFDMHSKKQEVVVSLDKKVMSPGQ